jgi:UDP-N-acetylmuramate--alanine ligase
MNLDKVNRVFFLGIGGIGMSALARFFIQRGVEVRGYDRTETELTQQIAAEGAVIHYDDSEHLLWKEAELVVYTPAIPKDSVEMNWYLNNKYQVYKRSDVLQWISEGHRAITVAGTHGKTTVSTMIAHLLRHSGFGGTAFLGGIAANYNSNFWGGEGNTVVVEADEYDRSFLKLRPDVAVLTAMDPDHLDIYGTEEAMEEAFIEYTRNIKPEGQLVVKHGLKRSSDLHGSHVITYSLQNSAANAYAANIVQRKGGYELDVVTPLGIVSALTLPIGGMHNVENAVVAVTVAMGEGLSAQDVRSAFADFKGVKRRFEYVLKNERIVFIDDYAHHPEELSALIGSAKRLFSKRRCVVAFQPHLFSRTRDLADGFAHSLDMADEIILLDIYPARELPMDGVSSQMIADKMQNKAHTILAKEALVEYVRTAPLDLFITAGAGDIDKLVDPIKNILQQKS